MASLAEQLEAMTSDLFLGIDGGGSRCRARLETADGRLLGQGLSGPASMRFGFETAREAIMAATRQTLREANLPEEALQRVFAGIGLAGTGQRGAREALESWRHPFAGAWFEGDAYLALLGAFGGRDGGIVIAGTGSIGLAYQDKTVRVGGYGFPFSDEGSGADIGLRALRHALRTLDGRAEQSELSREVLATFGDDLARVGDWAEHATATDYAAMAPIVARHALAGDVAARCILQEAAKQIAELITALFSRNVPQVALAGGLADILRLYLPPPIAAQLTTPEADAVAGGILLARTKRSETKQC
jgi:glucosamine kinase